MNAFDYTTKLQNKKFYERDQRILNLLNEVIYPCAFGTVLVTERPQLEGVHAWMCAKEMDELLQNDYLRLTIGERPVFDSHDQGKEIVKSWARSLGLEFEEEVDISVGVADVLVYADEIGIFEIGTTRPSKMILLLRYIVRMSRPFTAHFWPYGTGKGFAFQNWFRSPIQKPKKRPTFP